MPLEDQLRSDASARIPLTTRVLASLDRLRSLLGPGYFRLRLLRIREKYRPDYRVVGRALLKHIDFESVFDVGCANGFLLSEFEKAGRHVAGIDLSPDILHVVGPRLAPHVEVGDFTEARGRYDLVCCVEVAEHLKPARSEELVEKVTSLATRWIYFTAAPPGQLGRGHINCRPHREWLKWFSSRGWVPDEEKTEAVRADMGGIERAIWLPRNSFILRPDRADHSSLFDGERSRLNGVAKQPAPRLEQTERAI